MNWASGRAEPMGPDGLAVMVGALEKSIALDSAKNLLVLRPAVSQW